MTMAGLRDVICVHELQEIGHQYVPLTGNKIHYAAKKIVDPDSLIEAILILLVQSVAKNAVPLGALRHVQAPMSYDQRECDLLGRIGVNPIVVRHVEDAQHCQPHVIGAQWLDHNALRRDMVAHWLDGQPGLTSAFKSFLGPFLAAEISLRSRQPSSQTDPLHRALKAPHWAHTGLYIPTPP
jgi:hypothetical protein